jgi:ADP-ribose pyrophosphatase YjhB (NUDIX family)
MRERERPLPCVGIGAVVFRGDDVLLIRRGKPPRQGDWSIPGGLQELGETVFEAARREVLEETGVAIEPLMVIDVVDLIERNPTTGNVDLHYTLVDVLALWLSGEPRPGDDAADAAWVDLGRLASLRLWAETERIIRAAHVLSQARRAPA